MTGRKLVAWNLRRLRVRKGFSQEALAADASVDRAYVGRLERGLENPTVAVLDRLVAALQADLVDLFRKPRSGAAPPKTLRAGRKPPAK